MTLSNQTSATKRNSLEINMGSGHAVKSSVSNRNHECVEIKSPSRRQVLVVILLLSFLSLASYVYPGNTFFVSLKFSNGELKPDEMKNEKVTEITTTNYGWYHPDPKEGLKNKRCLAMKEFYAAVEAHDRFNASAWQDLDRNPDSSRPIIAFLDIDACQLLHWPIFGGWQWNSDNDGNRAPFDDQDYSDLCPTIEKALQSPALAAPDSRLVVLSCIEKHLENFPCLIRDRTKRSSRYSKLVVGHLSALKKDAHPLDFGLPPWPVKTVAVNKSQIEECQNTSRNLLFSFIGRQRVPFPQFHEYLEPLHGKEGVHAVFSWKHYSESTHPDNIIGTKAVAPVAPENQTLDEFYNLMVHSVFAGAPLGDCAYTVRFSEILSSGAIPVVYSDNWVLPYNRDVVDWSELAVLLPQRRINETLTVLRSIPLEKQCEMRKKGYQFFQEYVADSAGRLKAVLQIMDAARRRRQEASQSTGEYEPMEFSAAPERRKLREQSSWKLVTNSMHSLARFLGPLD